MKKLIALVCTLLCAATLFTGCAKESQLQPTEVKNVSISISEVSPTGATVTIKDTNAVPFTYGGWFKVEKESHGKWVEIDTVISSYAVNCVGFVPDSNDEIVMEIKWEWLYGELPAGTYRLLKEAGEQYIAVEFDVPEM